MYLSRQPLCKAMTSRKLVGHTFLLIVYDTWENSASCQSRPLASLTKLAVQVALFKTDKELREVNKTYVAWMLCRWMRIITISCYDLA